MSLPAETQEWRDYLRKHHRPQGEVREWMVGQGCEIIELRPSKPARELSFNEWLDEVELHRQEIEAAVEDIRKRLRETTDEREREELRGPAQAGWALLNLANVHRAVRSNDAG